MYLKVLSHLGQWISRRRFNTASGLNVPSGSDLLHCDKTELGITTVGNKPYNLHLNVCLHYRVRLTWYDGSLFATLVNYEFSST